MRVREREWKEKDWVVEGNEGEGRESMNGDLKGESSVGHFRFGFNSLGQLDSPSGSRTLYLSKGEETEKKREREKSMFVSLIVQSRFGPFINRRVDFLEKRKRRKRDGREKTGRREVSQQNERFNYILGRRKKI